MNNYSYKFKHNGLFTKECAQKNGSAEFMELIKCFKCKNFGHFAKDCKEKQSLCFFCKKLGHLEKECSQVNHKVSHFTRECPQGDGSTKYMEIVQCLNCEESGKFIRNCKEKHFLCFFCEIPGHLKKESPQLNHKVSHFTRECPQEDGSTKYIESVERFECNDFGHFAHDCKQEENFCFCCKKPEHFEKNCSQYSDLDFKTFEVADDEEFMKYFAEFQNKMDKLPEFDYEQIKLRFIILIFVICIINLF